MFKNNSNKKNRGYTIIETMIAISLFVTILTIGMGTLLQANVLHQKSQDMRSILDNLSFMMEEMSRNLRTGYTYHCDLSGSLDTPRSCASGTAIVFEEAHGDPDVAGDQWAYRILSNGKSYDLSKSDDNGSTWTQLNPTEVKLTSASGFSVLGAEDPTFPDTQQPLVVIRLVGNITYKNITSPFSLQTSASQRISDN